MKKDIIIPVVKDVFMAAVYEWNEEFASYAWYAYLINKSELPLEAIMIISQAEGTIDGELRKSTLFRHAFPKLEAGATVKVELLDENIFQLDNRFMVTFFSEGTLYDKNYVFPTDTIAVEHVVDLGINKHQGVLSQ